NGDRATAILSCSGDRATAILSGNGDRATAIVGGHLPQPHALLLQPHTPPQPGSGPLAVRRQSSSPKFIAKVHRQSSSPKFIAKLRNINVYCKILREGHIALEKGRNQGSLGLDRTGYLPLSPLGNRDSYPTTTAGVELVD
ncbi:MAG: hypothetical protein VKK80_14130, partial [Prochlorothrix sp.]|nr:hypothetical protein [Prochlorothrix sp.]